MMNFPDEIYVLKVVDLRTIHAKQYDNKCTLFYAEKRKILLAKQEKIILKRIEDLSKKRDYRHNSEDQAQKEAIQA